MSRDHLSEHPFHPTKVLYNVKRATKKPFCHTMTFCLCKYFEYPEHLWIALISLVLFLHECYLKSDTEIRCRQKKKTLNRGKDRPQVKSCKNKSMILWSVTREGVHIYRLYKHFLHYIWKFSCSIMHSWKVGVLYEEKIVVWTGITLHFTNLLSIPSYHQLFTFVKAEMGFLCQELKTEALLWYIFVVND